MTVPENDPLQALRQLAVSLVNRPLTEPESVVVEQWARENLVTAAAGQAEARSAVEQGAEQSSAALKRTEQTIRETQAQTASVIQTALQAVRKAADDAKQAVEAEERAILDVIQRAQSLAELRETNRAPGAGNVAAGTHMVLHQIGSRLETLIVQQVAQEVGGRMKLIEAMTAQRLGEIEQRVQQTVEAATGGAGGSPNGSGAA